jgi:hypothetical protein
MNTDRCKQCTYSAMCLSNTYERHFFRCRHCNKLCVGFDTREQKPLLGPMSGSFSNLAAPYLNPYAELLPHGEVHLVPEICPAHAFKESFSSLGTCEPCDASGKELLLKAMEAHQQQAQQQLQQQQLQQLQPLTVTTLPPGDPDNNTATYVPTPMQIYNPGNVIVPTITYYDHNGVQVIPTK